MKSARHFFQVRLKINCIEKDNGTPMVFQVKWFLRRSPCSGIYRVVQNDEAFKLFNEVEVSLISMVA